MSEILAIISVAVLSSFGHCYSMCGGFNIAFVRLNQNEQNPFILSLVYHSFRILAYVCLGFLFGSFGSILAINAKIQNLSFFLLGLFMVFLGLALIIRGKILALIENAFIYEKFLKVPIKRAMNFKGIKGGVILGFLNGLIPCGLVYFYLASAMSKNSINGALIMLIFGLSTLPALLFFSLISNALNQNFKQLFSILSYILIILYGIILAYLGLRGFK
ncbi:sulfite exporter TauE/SafE family protein [Campylobacter sp. LR291e]|uniref:sulfite exporter TauE/SafE family protein n=1 Tax=unclassified Campylobacter TaxID=2593542 RepID=UPI00398A30CD